ncbi:MAG: pteridine reductase [Gammaproteobacteria bacterium]
MSNPPVALVTGAANRIGATIARVLHRAGYSVIVHYRSSADAAHTLITELNAARNDSARTVRADLAEFAQLETLAQQSLAQWGRLDVLVNNASSFYPTALDEIDEGDWYDLMNSNARAPLFLSKHLHAALAANGGAIVNIVDSTALDGVAGFAPYTMAKAALANMTKSLARELAPRVRVNGVSPGAILWPEYAGGISDDEKQRMIAQTALGRMGTPDDIAQAVLFLARDASYVTGQVIAVDGGV